MNCVCSFIVWRIIPVVKKTTNKNTMLTNKKKKKQKQNKTKTLQLLINENHTSDERPCHRGMAAPPRRSWHQAYSLVLDIVALCPQKEIESVSRSLSCV